MDVIKDRDVIITKNSEDSPGINDKVPEKKKNGTDLIAQNPDSKIEYSGTNNMWKDYLDFELEIDPGSGREYPIAVIRSPSGEARETMHFPFDELALENRLLSLRDVIQPSDRDSRNILPYEYQKVKDFGCDLFNALITGEVRNRFDVSMERARMDGRGLRLKLRIRPPELAVLPWEFLCDPRQAEYLCLSLSTSVVRYLELPQPVQPLNVKPPLRILGMIASPSDLESLNINHEKLQLEKAIKDLQANGLVELTWLEGQTWRDLQRAIRTGIWHIFHFIGHGGFDSDTGEGLIALADEDGQKHLFTAMDLGRLLSGYQPLRLVILNSCEGAKGSEHDIFSSTASILVRRGIPAVLAMQYRISDSAAIEFSRTFYETLADGMPVDAAVAEARKAISIAIKNTVEWGTPVIFMRSPDGMVFDLKESKIAVDDDFKRAKIGIEKYMLWKRAKTEARKAEARTDREVIDTEHNTTVKQPRIHMGDRIGIQIKDSFVQRMTIGGGARKCPNCGSEVEANGKFCMECGAKL